MAFQLPLGIGLRESASFQNYVPGDNQVLCAVLRQTIVKQGENSLYLWGTTGTGKSHLLQAACQHIATQGGVPVYIPLLKFRHVDVTILDDLDTLDLICVDDIQAIVGMPAWEHALFQLFNRLRDQNIPQLISGHVAPNRLGLQLPDLTSRLNWGGVFALLPLDVDSQLQALQQHAHSHGLRLSKRVAIYLLERCAHDMQTLVDWLQRLDYASLATRRKLSLSFVRYLLDTPEFKGLQHFCE